MFLERLFEMEIPEIEDGIIEVKAVSRSAADRSKIVVYSSDQRIDAVGACVGVYLYRRLYVGVRLRV